MTMVSSNYYFATVVIVILMANMPCEAQLSSTFYDSTCPNALSTIQTTIRQAVTSDQRMAASLIRLHFHDCFVQGCDASVLLDDTASFTGEQTALQNNDSIRGLDVIADAKVAVEGICPGVVSCADILTVAARDASEAVGGPSWTVTLGRRDSPSASRSLAESQLPRFTDPLSTLISNFDTKGLSERDMVALSGAHTIGQARCVTFRDRIYGNDSIDAEFATARRQQCPQSGGEGNLAPLDEVTPNSFDNNYFSNLVQSRGLLQSDQVLFSGGSSDGIVREYSNNPATFSADFAAAMVRMGDISPLTGDNNGSIRRICGSAN